jgi:hypothetical protein
MDGAGIRLRPQGFSMGFRILLLRMLLSTSAFAKIGEPWPRVEAAEEKQLFFTGAVTFPPSIGFKARAELRYAVL